MKKRTLFYVRCYAAVVLFVLAAYSLSFQQGHWLNNLLAYNLSAESDAFPTLERYAALLIPKPEGAGANAIPAQGFRRFVMPVDGEIVVEYKDSNGVILKSQPGNNVIAGDDGKISAIKYSKGVGWYIDIDHGSGIFSRYANLKNIQKKVGEGVTRGEVLAKVSEAYNGKFFLQLFINGKAVNPVTATLMRKGI